MSLEAKTHLDPRAFFSSYDSALRRRAEREEFARWGDHDQWTKDREVA